MARNFQRQAIAVAIILSMGLPLVLGAATTATGEGSGSAPTPLAAPPLAVPLLEHPQAKVDIGAEAPSGPAMSYVGTQNAWVNFSVWWWDTGPATSAAVFVDGSQYTMTEVPGQDGVYENGTLYRAMVNATDLAAGSHSWYYSFTGPSGSTRLPATGTMGDLVLDDAELWLDQGLIVGATQSLAAAYQTGNLVDLRAVVEQAVALLDPRMTSSWNGTEIPYDYTDPNHNITAPVALTAGGAEVYVGQNGMQRAGYGDSSGNNSQPAHKQALAMRGLLLASGLFNSTDLVIMSEAIDINGTPFYHTYLQVALNDASELAGDGQVDGDGLIDVDLWGAGLDPSVTFGKHFGDEDLDTADDVLWGHSYGWPPQNETAIRKVLWHRASAVSVSTPNGASLTFHIIQSSVNAQTTLPYALQAFWKDEPLVFDALSSNHSMYLDLRFTWSITAVGINGAGPVWWWTAPPQLIGQYSVALTVIDVYGNQDTVTLNFFLRAKTELRQPMPNLSFVEDSRLAVDLRAYFGDDDGFSTITFDVRTTPSQITVERTPPTAPNFSLVSAADWCGVGTGSVGATDGASPVVYANFTIAVSCVNDAPVLSGIPDILTFEEGGQYVIDGLSNLSFDADGDPVTWTMPSSNIDMLVDTANDRLVFTSKDPAWFGTDGTALQATDGAVSVFWPVTFIVTSVNDGPVITAPIQPYTVEEDVANVSIALSDHFFDPDGDTLEAEVTAETGLEAGYHAALGAVWFHPTANFSGPTGLTIRVRDASNASVTVTVAVDVTAVNDPPLLLDHAPTGYVTGIEGESFIFVVQALDSDSSVLTYEFYIDGDYQSASTSGSFQWQSDFNSSGRHEVEVVITDQAGGEVGYAWQIQLANVNRAPTVEIVIPGGNRRDAGDTVELIANGFDADEQALQYSWNFGGVIQPMSGRFVNVTFSSAGNYTVRVTVTDGEATAQASTSILIVYTPPPPPPPPPPPNGTNNTGGFLPGAPAALAVVVVATLMALVARRKREG